MIKYIREKLKDPKVMHIIRYLFFGGLTTLLNLGLYALFTRIFIWDENFSNVLAVVISVLFAYITNKLFVFKKHTNSLSELFRECLSFFGGRGLTIALDIGGLYLFYTVIGFPDMIVKVTINIIVVILNYVISRFFVFVKKTAS